ncbi:hypothetical protein [Bordetella genomosp. 10]|uniref:hypothetical protein n=1 Tax=Bordetella genomosp. 10 TaxID=1416804 RepID=UPI0015C611D8|nr:hypothetical protein [Bordetella genomosp. 10]
MTIFRLIAFVLSCLAPYALAKLGPSAISAADLRSNLSTLVGAASALLGFLVSAGALLYAVANTTLARNLQRTGHFQALLSDLYVCASAYFVALGISVASLFIPTTAIASTRFSLLEVAVAVVVFSNSFAYLLLIPLGRKMWLLLSNIQPENPGRLE